MPDRDLSMALIGYYNDQVAELTRQLADDEIEVGTWQITMRQLLRDAFADQLRAACEPNQPDSADYLVLGPMLRAQYDYLEGFARDVASGYLTYDQIVARGQMYMGASQEAYWQLVESRAEIELPAYPGDGTSECLGYCGCEWVLRDDGWHWVRGKDDSCPTCLRRAEEWAPYIP